MPNRIYTRLLIIILLVLTVASGYNYFKKPFIDLREKSASLLTISPTPSLLPAATSTQTQNQLDQLTDQEKVWQLLAVPLTLNENSLLSGDQATPSAQLELISQAKPGFVLLYGDQVDALSVKKVIEQIRQSYPVDYPQPVIMVDHEGGSVQRLSGDGFTDLPSWRELCQLPQTERNSYLDQSAQELASVGVNLVLSPMVDVASKSAVLKDRACSGDPQVVIAAANDYIQVFAGRGLTTVLKHYPGIGSITKDIHLQFDHLAILESDILPFDTILEKYPTLGVMTSHVGVNGKNETLPCSLSTECLAGLVETYPKALIFSDDLTMKSASYDDQTKSYSKPLDQVALEALIAGNQVLVFARGTEVAELQAVAEKLLATTTDATESRTIVEKINNSAKRVLDLKQQIFNQ